MALNRYDLDLIAARGCQIPGCSHEHKEEGIFVHSKCHPEKGVFALFEEDESLPFTAKIICAKCTNPIVQVLVEVPNELWLCECRASQQVSYHADEHQLKISCAKCQQTLVKLEVSDGGSE